MLHCIVCKPWAMRKSFVGTGYETRWYLREEGVRIDVHSRNVMESFIFFSCIDLAVYSTIQIPAICFSHSNSAFYTTRTAS